jgi:RNA-binding protein
MKNTFTADSATLTGKQLRFLRGLGHHLAAKVVIGRQGITEPLLASVEAVLSADELIKVKISSTSEVDRQQAAAIVAERTGALIVQVLGKTFLLYRENRDKKAGPKIQLP